MSQELTIITHTYDLRVWTLQHTEKFPRSHRHELGRWIENKMHELFDLLIEAKFTSQKAEFLRKAASASRTCGSCFARPRTCT